MKKKDRMGENKLMERRKSKSGGCGKEARKLFKKSVGRGRSRKERQGQS